MKILLLGDISPTEVTAPLFREKNIPELFGDAVSIFDNKDFIFVNLECALTEHDLAIKKFGPALKAPKETADVLKALGVNCCGISNNHVFDYGVKGMEDTFAALNDAKLDFTGFGDNYDDSRKNYTVERNGEKICIIAVCEHEYSYALKDRMGSRPYDEYDTIEDIRDAKAMHDKVIVIYHGGKELCHYPSPRLRKLCRAMARNGADVVLCQHSHCIGTFEEYSGCHILYGQGNFHFVKPSKTELWSTGLAVVYDTVENKMEFIPLRKGEKGISLAKGEDADNILEEFKQHSQNLHNDEWLNGWHTFCESMKDDYTKVIGRAGREESSPRENARFSHFLDCEAHTDVWRELFPSYNLTNEK